MIFRKISLLFIALLCVCNCFAQIDDRSDMYELFWVGKLKLNDTTLLCFDFEWKYVKGISQIVIHNADERITVDEIRDTRDSLNFTMPVFDSEFRCKKSADSLTGRWINHARKTNNVLPFSASKVIYGYGKNGGIALLRPPFNGKWEVTFNPGTADEYKGIGLFKHASGNSERVTGTILTETGDYRYLDGVAVDSANLYLSCFDGAHAFVFKAKLKSDSSLSGDFWAGSHGHEKWVAKRNEKFELRNPDSLTYLKPGYTKLDFSFPNLAGKKISLSDEKFKYKVVIVQIMGSWCPNCMDETKFLSAFYSKQQRNGVEVVSLAYERTGDMKKAVANVERIKAKYVCTYEMLIAGLTSDRVEAAKTLPALTNIMAFPTTIFIDRKGNVRKIYTGFNGPATGKYYDQYVEDMNSYVSKLLKE